MVNTPDRIGADSTVDLIAQLPRHDKWVADWRVIRRTHACWMLNVNPNTVRESFILRINVRPCRFSKTGAFNRSATHPNQPAFCLASAR